MGNAVTNREEARVVPLSNVKELIIFFEKISKSVKLYECGDKKKEIHAAIRMCYTANVNYIERFRIYYFHIQNYT